jgi:hypothetical protein
MVRMKRREVSATDGTEPPRSALGPCRSGPVGAAAVTIGHQRSRGPAGRRASGSRSWDDARGRFGLWSRRSDALDQGLRWAHRPDEQPG